MALAGMASEGEDRVVLEEQELVLAEAPAGARGGEVTYHGPGQLVAYPIVALAAPVAESARPGSSTLGVRRFVEALEAAMADTCAAAGVIAGPRAGHPGCWVDADGHVPRKIGALGIRVARGVTFHGIALNVTTDLADFDLIDPCGMPGLCSTSLARERQRARFPGADADAAPSTASVAKAAAAFAPALARRLERAAFVCSVAVRRYVTGKGDAAH